MLLRMRNMQKNRGGVTFIELLVAIVLLAATIGSMLSLFSATKRWIEISQSRMTVGELSKYTLDPLQMWVRQDQWAAANNCLTTGTNCGSADVTIQNRQYNVTYAVTPGPLNLIRVRVDFDWYEPVF